MSTNHVPSALVFVAQRTGGPMVTHTLPTTWPVVMSVTVPDRDGSTANGGVEGASIAAAMKTAASSEVRRRIGEFPPQARSVVSERNGVRPVLTGERGKNNDIHTDSLQPLGPSTPDEALHRGLGGLVVGHSGDLVHAHRHDDEPRQRPRARHRRDVPPEIGRGVPELGARARGEVAPPGIFG